MAMWEIAKKYTLADNFFMGAFGGSFFNHQWLICACAPYYPECRHEPGQADDRRGRARRRDPEARRQFAEVGDGRHPEIRRRRQSDARLLRREHDAAALPAERQRAGQGRRSGLGRPGQAHHAAAADRADDRRPAQPQAASPGPGTAAPGRTCSTTATRRRCRISSIHHQPFNYYASFAPGTAARAEHLRDGGLGGAEFIKAIDAGKLPQVAFYKPQGNLNEHSGYADIPSGDRTSPT